MVWCLMAFVTFVVMYNIYRYYHEDEPWGPRNDNNTSDTGSNNDNSKTVDEKSTEKNHVEETIMDEKKKTETMEGPKTRELVCATLRRIGCTPQDTESGHIQFDYQGINFLIEAENGWLFVNLIWPWCHSCSKFDIDEFSRIRQVVNDINARGTASVFYSITDSDEVAVHIQKNFLFVEQIPYLENYLKSIFDSFFRTARTLDVEIEKARMQETAQ